MEADALENERRNNIVFLNGLGTARSLSLSPVIDIVTLAYWRNSNQLGQIGAIVVCLRTGSSNADT
jgi:hypothetical protein